MDNKIEVLEKKLETLEKLVSDMHNIQSQMNDATQNTIDELNNSNILLKNFLVETIENQQKLQNEISIMKEKLKNI